MKRENRSISAAVPSTAGTKFKKECIQNDLHLLDSYAFDKVAPGTANDDTLLYGVEVKFYNMEVEVNEDLESCLPGLYVIGDASGITHSLSHASASGVYVARKISEEI